jgi:hypothetical protein
VKLRDHPLMTRKSGVRNWPPVWTTTRPYAYGKCIGEIGVLEQALVHQFIDNKIFLFVNHEDQRYMGLLSFDDSAFCDQVLQILRAHIGSPIRDIGSVDVSHTL